MSRTTIGKYINLEPIGQGGMAEVYIGVDPTLNRKVAIKLILPHFAEKSDFEARFQREAETIAGLRHSNIVQIYEYSIEDGTPFMVMEYLDGGTLADKLAEYKTQGKPLPLAETANILDKVTSGLDYAHDRGIIHRDIKPANILFSEDGEPIIADFGIVKLLNDTAMLTQTGGLVGSPRYLPPEQASQKEVDKRSDIYSLGIVVYQMVTGEVPFDGDMISVMMQHVNDQPKNPTTINAELPERTADVILKALEKDPHYRYDSAGEMATAFGNSLTDTAIPTNALGVKSVSGSKTEVPEFEEKTVPIISSEPRPKADKSSLKLIIGGTVGLAVIAVIVFIAFGGGFGRATGGTTTPVNTEIEVGGEILPEATDTPVVEDSAAENDREATPHADLEAESTTTSVESVSEINKEATVLAEQPVDEPTAIPIDTTIPRGDIIFHESTVTITLKNLEPLDEGFIYAAWLTEPESFPLYLGMIESDGGEISFIDPEDSDILMGFSGFAITEELETDLEPVFSGTIVFEAEVDEQIIQDYRHLKTISDISLDEAIRNKMMTQANVFTDHTRFSLTDILGNGSLDGGKNHAEHAINIASGIGSDNYFDWDGDGRPENPGDDVGLLPYARLFANAANIAETDADIVDGISELINQIEGHASLMMKITASDTLEEAAVHAEQLDAEQGQILEKITVLLGETEAIDFSTRFKIFATGN